jgi:hypothetical protein
MDLGVAHLRGIELSRHPSSMPPAPTTTVGADVQRSSRAVDPSAGSVLLMLRDLPEVRSADS